jgi:hypothetical protein
MTGASPGDEQVRIKGKNNYRTCEIFLEGASIAIETLETNS